MLACGLATHFVHSSKLDSLEEALIQVNTSDPRVLTLVIEEFSHRPSLKENTAYNSLHIINKCFSKGTVEEILYALETEPVKNDWIFAAIQTMRKVSPIGLKVSLSSIRKGRWQTVQQCLVREYRIMAHALRRDVSKDFFEGCRAIFIEKDRNPKWEPSVLEVISEEMVEHYFSKVDDVGEYLELFGRPELPAYAVAKL
ncbi:3-hydroxyisobutyryl-CoA hydrolase [Ranunculus cassubicifolius]